MRYCRCYNETKVVVSSACMSCFVLLVAVLAGTASQGVEATPRRLAARVTAVARPAGRHLTQGLWPFCPAGCDEQYCAFAATQGGFYCQKCLNNLLVQKNDGRCGCAAGKYSPNGNPTCVDCPFGHYCEGGVYTEADYPKAVRCPGNMTTRGLRSISPRSCVNLPGFSYYNLNGLLLALVCPANTYSPGLRKQIACVPCPTGFSTMGKTGQTLPAACVVPPGYYLKSPGQVAPCPTGEFKSGTGSDGSCQKCAFGVTTPGQASTSNASCTLLIPGWYARSMSGSMITATGACPQGYYCPGGPAGSTFNPSNAAALSASESSIKRCPAGMWTVDLASTTDTECLTPPGFKTANGVTVPCESGSYRSGWAPAGLAQTCVSCGVGVFADKTDRVTQYNLVTNVVELVAVTSDSNDCYIMPGQGLYFETLTKSWRARNCTANTYGVDKIAYGLVTSACKPCPLNMVTSTNNATYPRSASWYVSDSTTQTAGFISPMACVNPAGYGYNGRVSQPCNRGTWSLQDTYGDCKACDYGLTTVAVGAGKSEADCGVAAGFGYDPLSSKVMPCPVGTYNSDPFSSNMTKPCTQCPKGTTTGSFQSDDASQCNLCKGGWGGTGCHTQCGGKGTSATYGDEGRPMGAECTKCSWSSTGFSYNWNGGNDLFIAQAVAAIGADSSFDCVAEFAQLADSAWYLPTAGNAAMNVTENVNSFSQCVALCIEPDCQYATYDYRQRICYIRMAQAPTYVDETQLIAFKAVPSGDVATNAYSIRSASEGGSYVRHRHGAPNSASGTDDTGSGSARFSAPHLTDGDSSSNSSDASNSGDSTDSRGNTSGSDGDTTADQPGSSDDSSNATDSSNSNESSSGGGSRRLASEAADAVQAASSVQGASLASGQYSFYIEKNALTVGTQTAAPDRDNYKLGYAGLQQCLDACDDRSWCVGVTMLMFTDVTTSPRSCSLIRGDTNPGRFIRTVTRADVNRLRVPSIFL